MTPEAFATGLLGWHDFFLAAAGASAALLGLLFVGVSINLAAIAADERIDLRARAGQAFANLISVLVIGLTMLIPDPDPRSVALTLGLVAALGFLRMARTGRGLFNAKTGLRAQLPTLRRLAWTLVADVLLGVVAIRIWQTADPTAIANLIGVIFVLLVGAADISWEMLTEVSAEIRP